jgi:hypothetical protein
MLPLAGERIARGEVRRAASSLVMDESEVLDGRGGSGGVRRP